MMFKEKQKKSKSILALLILVFAFVLRFYQLADNPPALNWDEVSHGYNAYSILKTGKDEWGMKFPLIFRAYGDYKLPLYIYFSVIPIAVLGLNPLGVRFISIFSGIGLVIVAYLIGKKAAKSQFVGLLSAFLTAVSPWSLFLSRAAVEANLGAFLVALGSWAVIKKRFVLAAILWGFSLHTYNSARVLILFLGFFVVLQLFRNKSLKKLAIFGIILAFFVLPIVGQVFSRQASARLFWVSLIEQGTVNRIIENRLNSKLPALLTHLIHNRPNYFLIYSIRNYLAHFSPQFLFLQGGSHYQFSMQNSGILYLATAPFLLLGIITSRNWFLLFWYFAAFLPSAITRDSPHVLRSILVLPLPMVFTSLGVQKMMGLLKKKIFRAEKLFAGIFIFAVFVSFGAWWYSYWRDYRINYSWSWQYGYEEMVAYVRKNYDEYDEFLITKKYGEPHEFFLFYWPWDPKKYQEDQNLTRYFQTNWYWVDSFDKFKFINDWEIIEKTKDQKPKTKNLLITSPGNYSEGWRKIKTINFLDDQPAFEILER